MPINTARPSKEPSERIRLAVLPFAALKPADQTFSAGITAEVIRQLSSLDRRRVGWVWFPGPPARDTHNRARGSTRWAVNSASITWLREVFFGSVEEYASTLGSYASATRFTPGRRHMRDALQIA